MGATSKIEWTDATWTPIRAARIDNGKAGVHCEKVSEACKNCYAERLNLRNLPAHGTGLPFNIVSRDKVGFYFDDAIGEQALRWRRPRKIFVCSQTDLFGEFVDDDLIAMTFAYMALASWHTFQVLTKRPQRLLALSRSAEFCELVEDNISMLAMDHCDALDRRRDDLRAAEIDVLGEDWPLQNVWLGVTAENQARADERIPLLLQTAAAVRFVSAEPLLGPIDLDSSLGGTKWIGGQRGCAGMHAGVGTADCPREPHHHHDDRCSRGLDWVITGGESGPGARPSHPEWFRSLRDQCAAAALPFFFKQWGEWAPGECVPDEKKYHCQTYGDDWTDCSDDWATEADSGPIVYRVGKQKAGRMLDGQEWSQFPAQGTHGRADHP